MDAWVYILAIGFWVLFALMVICIMAITYIKLIYYKWERDEKEWNRFINIAKNVHSDYSENDRKEN